MPVMENRSLLFSSCHLELAFSENIQCFATYRIRAIKLPLLIKLPLIQNSNKAPLFCPKSPLLGTDTVVSFLAYLPKSMFRVSDVSIKIIVHANRTFYTCL